MNNWYECRVRYEKTDARSGKTKKVTEPYLIDAITFSEAEERVYKALEPQISGEFTVKGISKSPITEVFNYPSGDRWFKARVSWLDIAPDSGRELKVSQYMLVLADNAREAYDRVHESLREMIVPFTVSSVGESPIMDIFPYDLAEAAEKLDQHA